MRIIQISDSHISRDHLERGQDLEALVTHINALDPQPDTVVHLGDVAHNGLAEEYAIARECLDRLRAPLFVVPGNKDRRPEFIAAFADGDHIRPDMAFVQYSVERFATRLVFADTLNATSNKGRLCGERLKHLETLVVVDRSRPTALFLHHPPFAVSIAPDPFQFEDWAEAEAVQALVARHPHVCGLYCGHVHRGMETVIEGAPASIVSSIAFDLRWDKAMTGGDRKVPVYKTHVLPTRVAAEGRLLHRASP
jgi:3',5'-cyclic-AMP phosphodiesterase